LVLRATFQQQSPPQQQLRHISAEHTSQQGEVSKLPPPPFE